MQNRRNGVYSKYATNEVIEAIRSKNLLLLRSLAGDYFVYNTFEVIFLQDLDIPQNFYEYILQSVCTQLNEEQVSVKDFCYYSHMNDIITESSQLGAQERQIEISKKKYTIIDALEYLRQHLKLSIWNNLLHQNNYDLLIANICTNPSFVVSCLQEMPIETAREIIHCQNDILITSLIRGPRNESVSLKIVQNLMGLDPDYNWPKLIISAAPLLVDDPELFIYLVMLCPRDQWYDIIQCSFLSNPYSYCKNIIAIITGLADKTGGQYLWFFDSKFTLDIIRILSLDGDKAVSKIKFFLENMPNDKIVQLYTLDDDCGKYPNLKYILTQAFGEERLQFMIDSGFAYKWRINTSDEQPYQLPENIDLTGRITIGAQIAGGKNYDKSVRGFNQLQQIIFDTACSQNPQIPLVYINITMLHLIAQDKEGIPSTNRNVLSYICHSLCACMANQEPNSQTCTNLNLLIQSFDLCGFDDLISKVALENKEQAYNFIKNWCQGIRNIANSYTKYFSMAKKGKGLIVTLRDSLSLVASVEELYLKVGFIPEHLDPVVFATSLSPEALGNGVMIVASALATRGRQDLALICIRSVYAGMVGCNYSVAYKMLATDFDQLVGNKYIDMKAKLTVLKILYKTLSLDGWGDFMQEIRTNKLKPQTIHLAEQMARENRPQHDFPLSEDAINSMLEHNPLDLDKFVDSMPMQVLESNILLVASSFFAQQRQLYAHIYMHGIYAGNVRQMHDSAVESLAMKFDYYHKNIAPEIRLGIVKIILGILSIDHMGAFIKYPAWVDNVILLEDLGFQLIDLVEDKMVGKEARDCLSVSKSKIVAQLLQRDPERLAALPQEFFIHRTFDWTCKLEKENLQEQGLNYVFRQCCAQLWNEIVSFEEFDDLSKFSDMGHKMPTMHAEMLQVFELLRGQFPRGIWEKLISVNNYAILSEIHLASIGVLKFFFTGMSKEAVSKAIHSNDERLFKNLTIENNAGFLEKVQLIQDLDPTYNWREVVGRYFTIKRKNILSEYLLGLCVDTDYITSVIFRSVEYFEDRQNPIQKVEYLNWLLDKFRPKDTVCLDYIVENLIISVSEMRSSVAEKCINDILQKAPKDALIRICCQVDVLTKGKIFAKANPLVLAKLVWMGFALNSNKSLNLGEDFDWTDIVTIGAKIESGKNPERAISTVEQLINKIESAVYLKNFTTNKVYLCALFTMLTDIKDVSQAARAFHLGVAYMAYGAEFVNLHSMAKLYSGDLRECFSNKFLQTLEGQNFLKHWHVGVRTILDKINVTKDPQLNSKKERLNPPSSVSSLLNLSMKAFDRHFSVQNNVATGSANLQALLAVAYEYRLPMLDRVRCLQFVQNICYDRIDSLFGDMLAGHDSVAAYNLLRDLWFRTKNKGEAFVTNSFCCLIVGNAIYDQDAKFALELFAPDHGQVNLLDQLVDCLEQGVNSSAYDKIAHFCLTIVQALKEQCFVENDKLDALTPIEEKLQQMTQKPKGSGVDMVLSEVAMEETLEQCSKRA